MAGTIFGLPLSQRVDINGQPLVGWLLYLYVQNSSTPVNSYQDTALTVVNTWPIEADASGMMPQFWLADGSYRVRATNNDGSLTLFDIPSVQAIGPSTGTAPSGGVDPTAIFQTGDSIWLDVQGVRTGWVRDNGNTIGSGSSGASERANADCQALFTFLWINFPNTICPVLGGRGASANADWVANKKITLPDKRGFIVGGLDDMGNSSAGQWTSVPVTIGNATTAGAKLGESFHQLTENELASHNHTINQTPHTHPLGAFNYVAPSPGTLTNAGNGAGLTTTSPNVTGGGNANISIDDDGGDQAHNNVQPVVLGTFFRKL